MLAIKMCDLLAKVESAPSGCPFLINFSSQYFFPKLRFENEVNFPNVFSVPYGIMGLKYFNQVAHGFQQWSFDLFAK